MCFYQNLVFVAEYHADCWQTLQWRLLWRIFGAQIDRKSKQVKEQWHGNFLFQPVLRTTCYFKHRKYPNLWMNNKVRGNKYAICLHFHTYLLNKCRKFEISLISHGSVGTYLRWVGYCRMGFVRNFIRFPAVQKFWKSVKIWFDKVTESWKVGTLLRHSVLLLSLFSST